MPKADNYAKINMPAAFLTPHDIQTSDGRTFEKCFVSFPKGTCVPLQLHEEGHA